MKTLTELQAEYILIKEIISDKREKLKRLKELRLQLINAKDIKHLNFAIIGINKYNQIEVTASDEGMLYQIQDFMDMYTSFIYSDLIGLTINKDGKFMSERYPKYSQKGLLNLVNEEISNTIYAIDLESITSVLDAIKGNSIDQNQYNRFLSKIESFLGSLHINISVSVIDNSKIFIHSYKVNDYKTNGKHYISVTMDNLFEEFNKLGLNI